MNGDTKIDIVDASSIDAAKKILADAGMIGLIVNGCYGNVDMSLQEVTDQLDHFGIICTVSKAMKVKQNEKRYDLVIGFEPDEKLDIDKLHNFAEENEMDVVEKNKPIGQEMNEDKESIEYLEKDLSILKKMKNNGVSTVAHNGDAHCSIDVAIKDVENSLNFEKKHPDTQKEIERKDSKEKTHQDMNEMDTFDVKKRQIMSFDEFGKTGTLDDDNLKILKGRTGIVKDAMSGEKQGKGGYATLEDPKRINIKESLNEDSGTKVGEDIFVRENKEKPDHIDIINAWGFAEAVTVPKYDIEKLIEALQKYISHKK